mmetsp:Transcript_19971/g.56584  ORF Transcript_19971/g.56584 Transcript_19971/m.56584 type:complete len:116 (+) Transcript_19971:825-1172(+)
MSDAGCRMPFVKVLNNGIWLDVNDDSNAPPPAAREYGDAGFIAGQRNPTKADVKRMANTPTNDMGANAASDDRLHSGRSVVTARIDTHRDRDAKIPPETPANCVKDSATSPSMIV